MADIYQERTAFHIISSAAVLQQVKVHGVNVGAGGLVAWPDLPAGKPVPHLLLPALCCPATILLVSFLSSDSKWLTCDC